MKVAIIDNHLSDLESLELVLRDIPTITTIRKYSDPFVAFLEVHNFQPDVIFLEIEIREIDGLRLGNELKQQLPNVKIVFITTSHDYVVKAISIGAFDYLLKPINFKRVNLTIEKVLNERKQTDCTKMMVCLFQRLHFQDCENNLEIDVKWRTNKAKEIFTYLVVNRKRFVSKDTLIDLFWPESDINNGYALLYTTIYNIRKAFKKINCPIVIESKHDCYKLNLNNVLVDIEEFESILLDYPTVTHNTIDKHKQNVELYKDDLLIEEGYSWAENERERLKVLWINYFPKITKYYTENHNYSEAVLFNLNIQKILPYHEDIYFELMKLYDKLGNRDLVKKQYHSLKTMLEENFTTTPSEDIREWYENWLN